MNITISRRSKSYNNIPNARFRQRQLQNQQSAQTHQPKITNKNYSLNKATHHQQENYCTKWLLSRCLKKPSIVDDELLRDKSISLKKTKDLHNITAKKATNKVNKIEAQQKLQLFSKKDKILFKRPQCKINVVCNRLNKQIQVTERLTKRVYLQQQPHIFQESKNCPQTFKNSKNSNESSNDKVKSKLIQFSLKPSTVMSSNNYSCQKEKDSAKSKLKLSNHYQSIMATDIKPFNLHYTHKPLDEQKSVAFVSNQCNKQTSEHIQDEFSRFELVYPSQNEFKIVDPYKSNHSIDTSYIRKRIQFSSEFSDRAKLENYVYEPVYMINKSKYESHQKNHKNYNSELVKSIRVQNEEYFNSAKQHSEQSLVLEKGLDQIFNFSPTFKKISESENSHEIDDSIKHITIQKIDDYELHSNSWLDNYGKMDEIKQH